MNEEKIMSAPVMYELVDEAYQTWLITARLRNIPISATVLKTNRVWLRRMSSVRWVVRQVDEKIKHFFSNSFSLEIGFNVLF